MARTCWGTVDGGAGRDTRVYDIAGQATLGALQGFEGLEKRGDGALRIDGPDATGLEDVEVLGGTLHVRVAGAIEGVLQSRVAHAASLQVDGHFAGSAGADTMTVAGVVLGSGRVDLGAGNDMLVLQDGADLSGLSQALAGGDGEDTLHVDIAGTTALAGVTQFERLDKRGTGTLQILGVAPSDFARVAVDAGTVEVGAAGSITDVVDTHIAAGATLHVDGHYAGSGGDDTLTVAGRLSGSATVDLADGDDTLIVREGAEFANRVVGGAGSDTLLLDNAAALAFEAGAHSDFERLHKRNTGTAVLVGRQDSAYTEGVRIDAGTLVVDASRALRAPTLYIAGDTDGDFATYSRNIYNATPGDLRDILIVKAQQHGLRLFDAETQATLEVRNAVESFLSAHAPLTPPPSSPPS